MLSATLASSRSQFVIRSAKDVLRMAWFLLLVTFAAFMAGRRARFLFQISSIVHRLGRKAAPSRDLLRPAFPYAAVTEAIMGVLVLFCQVGSENAIHRPATFSLTRKG